MKPRNIFAKVVVIAVIGGACFVASLLVLGTTWERQAKFEEAKKDIAESWSKRQYVIGPMLVVRNMIEKQPVDTYVLPETLNYETTLEPEVRSRGIFRSVVYTGKVNVSGDFSLKEIKRVMEGKQGATFSVIITDTRGIEKQVDLTWGGAQYAFEPGAGITIQEFPLSSSSGLHTNVPLDSQKEKIPFSFSVDLKGTEGISFAPLGKETLLRTSSPWPTPKFVGAFLPTERSITNSGFTSEWRISSFGRPYPQTWQSGTVGATQLVDSTAGVDLHEQIDAYDLVFRSIKYAILFIVITFAAFFLFDILMNVRIHAIQYLLIGSALSLFYLLLLSLVEHTGFLVGYTTATAMIALLVSIYSAYVLKSIKRAVPIFLLLVLLYGYLYFVLQLEDYALLFGSLLLFVFLALIMFATRNIDWYTLEKPRGGE